MLEKRLAVSKVCVFRCNSTGMLNSCRATNNAVRAALSTSLTRILTPKTSTDLLLSIRTKLTSPLPSSQQRIPYSIVFVGVNGVGKSTNLSKVCFWLIQNGMRVLIAACDTFRRVLSLSSFVLPSTWPSVGVVLWSNSAFTCAI